MSDKEEEEFPVPETRVLAIASHVVYGHVGNSMAVFVMQVLGCEVAALNTVQFSNHTGYKQFKGTRFSADHIRELYEGLKQSYLTDFDALLSGYAPSAAAVEAVGTIARDLKYKATGKPGSFFWVLDPVMGDKGKLYVSEDVVPAYKEIIRDADLILPNQFEVEILSGIKIDSVSSLTRAITHLHRTYSIPHIIVTSIVLPSSASSSTADLSSPSKKMVVIGSSLDPVTHLPRLFKIHIPYIPIFFSGTGDLFASLILVRLREESAKASLLSTPSWLPPSSSSSTSTSTSPTDLPLARATEKVLASMHAILTRTMVAHDREMQRYRFGHEYGAGVDAADSVGGGSTDAANSEVPAEDDAQEEKRRYLAETKAAEVRLVRHVRELKNPVVKFRAEGVEEEEPVEGGE